MECATVSFFCQFVADVSVLLPIPSPLAIQHASIVVPYVLFDCFITSARALAVDLTVPLLEGLKLPISPLSLYSYRHYTLAVL